MTARRRTRAPVTVLALLAAWLAVGVVLTLHRDDLIGGVHALTGGLRPADVAVGALAVWAPLLLLVVGALVARRLPSGAARWLRRCWWLALLPWLPALALTPWSRRGTDDALLAQLDRRLPGFTAGLVAGTALLVGPPLVLGLHLRWQRRAGRRRPADGALRRGSGVEYTGASDPRRRLTTGDVGVVRRIVGDDVVADWPGGRTAVPLIDVRPVHRR